MLLGSWKSHGNCCKQESGNPEYGVSMVRTLNLDVVELDVEKLTVSVVANMLIYC